VIKKETKVHVLDIIKPGKHFLVCIKRSLDEVFTLKAHHVQYILILKITHKSDCTSAVLQFGLK